MATPASLPQSILKISGVSPLAGTIGLWQSMCIAAALGLSVHTVERHLTNLYPKIGCRSRTEAAAFALSHLQQFTLEPFAFSDFAARSKRTKSPTRKASRAARKSSSGVAAGAGATHSKDRRQKPAAHNARAARFTFSMAAILAALRLNRRKMNA